MIVEKQARFTVLSPTLIRMEYSPAGRFVDGPSVVVLHRMWPSVEYSREEKDGSVVIRTRRIEIRYNKDSGPFCENNLRVRFLYGKSWHNWRPGKNDPHNLGGTLPSLDGASESGLPPLPDGLLSRSGYYVLCDEQHALLTPDGWHQPRPDKSSQDWYFFGYGHDYALGLKEVADLTGRIPMLPHWAFGGWYSRYWPYNEEDLKEVVARFRREDIPLDVLVIDVDWHLHGWEGYDWNPECFPRPAEFLAWMHDQGLKITLNNHPGRLPAEDSHYPDVCRKLGVAHSRGCPFYQFNLSRKADADVFMDDLHRPFHAQGVDFWWIDGRAAAADGLDGQMWTNKIYFEKTGQYTDKRPLIFSRYGGLGSHRYPILFSGDAYSDWGVLRYQIPFTAAAGNALIPYWTHDIGGFWGREIDEELFVRWVQFGAFSPFLRLHSDHGIREPWNFSERAKEIVRAFFKLRYRLIPYIYTYSRMVHEEGLPLVRPLYLEWPKLDEAYSYRHEYLFGREFLVAPIDQPGNDGIATKEIYFPPGTWIDYYTGERTSGPTVKLLTAPLDRMPLFVRAGAIIPMTLDMPHSEARPLNPLVLDVYAGGGGSFGLYEDDGVSLDHEEGEFAWTNITYSREATKHVVTIGPTKGEYEGMLEKRSIEIRLTGIPQPLHVRMGSQPLQELATKEAFEGSETGWYFKRQHRRLLVKIGSTSTRQRTQVKVLCPKGEADLELLDRPRRFVEFGARLSGVVATQGVSPKIAAMIRDLVTVADTLSQQVVLGSILENDLRKKVEELNKQMATIVDMVVAEVREPEERKRLLTELFEINVRTRLGEVLSNEVILPVETVFALGQFSPEMQIASTLEMSEDWRDTVVGDRHFIASIKADQALTSRFLLKAPERLSADCLEFKVNNVLTWGEDNFDFSEEFVFRTSFLQAYHLIGPFENTDMRGLDEEYPPEREIDIAAEYAGKHGPVRWQKWPWRPPSKETGAVLINLRNIISTEHDVLAYAVTDLLSDQHREALILFGSTEDCVIWLNEKQVHMHREPRAAEPGQDRILVNLQKGKNQLLVKSAHRGGSWGFFLEVTDVNGRPIPGLINAYVR